jgi:hypothetical protein
MVGVVISFCLSFDRYKRLDDKIKAKTILRADLFISMYATILFLLPVSFLSWHYQKVPHLMSHSAEEDHTASACFVAN